MALIMQWQGDAYRSDLGGDPDEAAHAVTSLMVRDYVLQAAGKNPMRFAENYYDRLPKVALGHYPPGFYALAGAFLGPLPAITTLLILQAILLASLATLTAWFASRILASWLGGLAGLLVCLAPPIQKLTLLVMSDLFLAFACLLTTVAMAFFLDRPSRRASLAFGFAAAAAILIKGSGVLLALVPPLAILLSGRWRLLFRPALWLAPLPVLLLAFPWQWYSFKFTQEGMSGLSVSQHFHQAIGYYWDVSGRNLGWPCVIVLGILLLGLGLRAIRRQALNATEAALWALLIGGVVVVFTVPAGMSPRYLVPLIAPAFVLVVFGISSVVEHFRQKPCWFGGAVGVALLLISLLTTGQILPVAKNVHGFAAAVNDMAAAEPPKAGEKEAWLICSDARGEGAVVAASAFHETLRLRKGLRLLRATKELATMDWLGRDYVAAFADDQALLDHLAQLAVTQVVLDESVPSQARMPHFAQLKQALARPDSGWTLAESVPAVRGKESGELLLYRRRS